MKVKDIAQVIEKIAPLKLAQPWDNVGLLIGDENQEAKNILLTIDITSEVLAEAKRLKTDLIISYHPVIWEGLKKLTNQPPTSIIYNLIRAGIAVYSVHTALDCAKEGINDELARIIGIRDGKPIGDYVANQEGQNYKLVVFIPVQAVGKVSEAIFAAGAGKIGDYSHCAFTTEGTGSFLPEQGAKPAIGKKGQLEKVKEVRFETIVPADKLDEVIKAMKQAHPYETPAFDVFKLYNSPTKFGLGKIGELEKPLQVAQIAQKLKRYTDAQTIAIIGDENRWVQKVAVAAGSAGKLINTVIAEKTDCYITGELKHHYALAVKDAGLACICLGHWSSERFILKKLARKLQKQLKQLTIKISKKDSDPFKWK